MEKPWRRHLRSAFRAGPGLAFLLGTLAVLVPLQSYVAGPLFKNHDFIPRLINKCVRGLFGLKIEFNQASVPIEESRRTWYFANHMSPVDAFVLSKVLKKTRFVAAGWLTQLPAVNAAGKAGGVLFVSQKKDEAFKRQDRGKIAGAFNKGFNVGMFPEGWTNNGSTVELFRAGLVELLYGGAATDLKGNPVKLETDVVTQSIAIRVKSVNGEDAFANPALRDAYSMNSNKNTLSRIWNRLGYREITLELTVFPVLDPKNFPDAKALMNEAHRQIVGVVAPDQKFVGKSAIEATNGERKTIRAIEPK